MIDYINDSNNQMREAIASRIRSERKALNKTQEEFAEIIGYSKPTIISWERKDGKNRIPDIDQLLVLCSVFHCEAGYILCEYDTKTRTATDIQQETGLTEKSITALIESQNLYKQSHDKSEPTRNNCITDIINKLLEFSIGDDYENQDGYYFYYDIVRYKKLIKCKEYIESNFQVFAPFIKFYNRASVHGKGYTVYRPENVKKASANLEPFTTFEDVTRKYLIDMNVAEFKEMVKHFNELSHIYDNHKFSFYDYNGSTNRATRSIIAEDISEEFPNVLKETNHEALEYLKFSISKQFDKLLDEYVRDVTRPDLNKSIINSKL